MSKTLNAITLGSDTYEIIEFCLKDDMNHSYYKEYDLRKNGSPIATAREEEGPGFLRQHLDKIVERYRRSKKNTYRQIREGKIDTMREIFLSLGEEFVPYAEVLTNDEIVQAFNCFNEHAEETDSEAADTGMWKDCLSRILSKETIKKLKDKKAAIP